MNMRHRFSLIALVCATLLSSHPALAQFSQLGPKLVATGTVGNAQQGRSVSLSADGNTAIVGGDTDNGGAGAAWVWTRSGGVWTQQGTKLVGSGAVASIYGAGQGTSVSLSADGNTAIVGGRNDTGTWVWTRSGGVWTQQGTKLVPSDVPGFGFAGQGTSVSLSADGNTAIIGGPTDDNTNFTGAAWGWVRNGGVWTQQGPKLVGSGAVGPYTQQGFSVALSADGETAIVGGYGDNNFAGAAWVWTRSGGVWTQQGTKLVGSGATVGTHTQQGRSVALSADGNTAIVGGPGDGVTPSDNTGAAWVWTRSGGVWTQQGTKLVGPGGVSASTVQGFSVSLSADGNRAIVGGVSGNSQTSTVLAWTRNDGVWTQQGTRLVGSGAVGSGDSQQPGVSVSLSANGNTAIVGGYYDNSSAGAAWVFADLQPFKIGTYDTGMWRLDANGDGVFDPGVDKTFNWGYPGTTRVQGDWNGDGKQKAGLYVDGVWYLDYNGDGVWDGGVVDKVYGFGMAGAQPVVGDWNGDGKDEIGIYINGFWFLDMNGNGVWDGEPTDKMIIWGWSGVTPVIGDWNGDGRKKVGLFYNGLWYLDYDGNGTWDGGAVDKVYGFGMSGVQAMVGDWNGDGKDEIGIYLNGFWFLDMNGNGVWDGDTTDRMTILGWTGTTPVVGDWNGDGKTKIGTFINGYWYLDYNGNGVWDGESIDKAYVFGQAGDMPMIGRW